jgi:hypothetical protein
MINKAIIRCKVCGSTILEGRQLYYDIGVEMKNDGIDGEYFDGSGECVICQRRLCKACGDFVDGVCIDCRMEEEKSIHHADVAIVEKMAG